MVENRLVSFPSETERYVRFQLEQLSSRNEHHTFERICFLVAERRLSSNLMLATGPVSAGGDQGRDAESYYTSLPEELPGAGGFVGRATTEPLVVAASLQRDGLEAKVRADLASICGQGKPVARVAFFAAQDVPVAVRHRLEAHAREAHGVTLEIFDGQNVSHLLSQGGLLWVAQRYLDLPSHLVPDLPEEPQPEWYAHTLAALRARETRRLTPGAFSEVRDTCPLSSTRRYNEPSTTQIPLRDCGTSVMAAGWTGTSSSRSSTSPSTSERRPPAYYSTSRARMSNSD
jgi:hypothetical protein